MLAFLAMVLFIGSGCEESAEDALEELTGYQWDLGCNADYPQFDDPGNWKCLFAVNLDEETAQVLDQSFAVDISFLEDAGLDLDTEFQVVFGRASLVDSQYRLEFANKVKIEGGKIVLDGETVEKLGASVGSSGPGWYGCYAATKAFGFISGVVEDCVGALKEGILVVASDGPFFNYSASDGSWAVPSLEDKPGTVYFSDDGNPDCTGNTSAAVTGDENPKTDEPSNNDPFNDDTVAVTAGTIPMATQNSTAGSDTLYNFESDNEGFASTCDWWGVSTQGYGEFFPSGTETQYLWFSTGGNQTKSCTVTKAMEVPSGATKLKISYDYVSQEPYEWINSAYNDAFTAILQGEYDYVIHRSINTVDIDNAWIDVEDSDARTAGDIASSADAQYNATPYEFDAHLRGTGADTPRGPDDMTTGNVAEYDVSGLTEVVLIMTVSDVADAIYDSMAVIDWITFE